jgi:hypothetical protein
MVSLGAYTARTRSPQFEFYWACNMNLAATTSTCIQIV